MKNTLRPILAALLLLLLFSGISACSGTEEQNQNTTTEIDAGSDVEREPDADEPGCQDGVLNGLETDIDCGGPECDVCGIDARCEGNTDCSSGLCSLDGVCLAAPTCDDGILNNQETDVDCGGPNCSSCPIEDRCQIDTDCDSGYCSFQGLCELPTCDDGAKNGAETGVDCGGPDCSSCPIEESCDVNSDCETSSCQDNTCAPPTCDDGIQNGEESDVDCGGPDCEVCEEDQSCLIDTDCLTLDCRDDNTCGPARWSTVSAGNSGHTCATRTDGSLWCWGDNSDGKLGIDSTTESLTPARVGADSIWSDVSAGGTHSCAIRRDGSLWCWGYPWAALGLGPSSDIPAGSTLTPSRVGTGNDWNSISAGVWHTCAIDNSNGMWCWGDNASGEVVANYNRSRHNTPYSRGDIGHELVDIRGVHSCGITDSGYFVCWGANWNGQLGNGSEDEDNTSSSESGPWQAISAGMDNTCAISSYAERIWCWGRGDSGITGASFDNQTSPFELEGPSFDWEKVSVNSQHACAIRNGDLYCWGMNTIGEADENNSLTNRITEPKRYGSDTWESVSVGDRYTCAINTEQELWCWGLNDKGQLGDGTTTDRTAPFEVTLP